MTSLKPLRHITSRGRVRPWRKNKLRAEALANAYVLLAESEPTLATQHRNRAKRIAFCADRLEFVREDDEQLKLANRYGCKARLCPVCQGARARTEYVVLAHRVAAHAATYPKSLPALLTLTVPNVAATALSLTITDMVAAFRKMRKMKPFKRAVIGWRRSLEVTFNPEREDFHPHFHVLIFFAETYWDPAAGLYLSKAEWQAMWQQATGLPLAIVDIRRKGRDRDGVLHLTDRGDLAEAAKYVVKPHEVFADEATHAIVDASVVQVLHNALKHRRLSDYGGTLRRLPRPDKPAPFAEDLLRIAYIWSELIDAFGEIHGPDYWPEQLPPIRGPPDDGTV